jgi:hypothetical protein
VITLGSQSAVEDTDHTYVVEWEKGLPTLSPGSSSSGQPGRGAATTACGSPTPSTASSRAWQDLDARRHRGLGRDGRSTLSSIFPAAGGLHLKLGRTGKGGRVLDQTRGRFSSDTGLSALRGPLRSARWSEGTT